MFASPLVRYDINAITSESKVHPVDLLEQSKEFQAVIDGLKLSKSEIQVKKICATA